MEDGSAEKDLVTFESFDAFLQLLHQCLGLLALPPDQDGGPCSNPEGAAHRTVSGRDRRQANQLVDQLRGVLNPYSEQFQTYLLDPYLEQMIAPVSSSLRACVRSVHAQLLRRQVPASSNLFALDILGKIFYLYSRIRGYKTIIHFFPHEVDDLRPLLEILQSSMVSSDLYLHVPPPLRPTPAEIQSSFQVSWEPATVDQISGLARAYIGAAGIEREASVVLVGRLYQRAETHASLESFLTYAAEELGPQAKASMYLQTGILFSLCELLKVLEPQRVTRLLPLFQGALNSILATRSLRAETDVHVESAQLGKAYTKLIGRLALKQLPPRPRRRKFVRAMGTGNSARVPAEFEPHYYETEEEVDVPEDVEGFIGELLENLSHEDSQVRYSAAKGVARISERLPNTFVFQVLDSVVSLFSFNSLVLPDGTIDLNAASEASWQGACFALAEMARRDLLSAARYGAEVSAGSDRGKAPIPETESSSYLASTAEVVKWIQRALMFDVRRGGRGVGTGVRDAACYVLWALARAHDVQSLLPNVADPHGIAAALVCVACCDREVSIRRAASAAFQEGAGRLGIFPHGLDVIRLADFLAVGVRRHCFLQVLPAVADYEPYRSALLDHLQSSTLAHWDASMRDLGAQALALVVRIQPDSLLNPAIDRVSQATRDPLLQHGRLLALARLAIIAREQVGYPISQRSVGVECALRCQNLATISSTGRLISEAACHLLAQTIDQDIYRYMHDQGEEGRKKLTQVTEMIQQALVRPEATVQWAAVDAVRSLTVASAAVINERGVGHRPDIPRSAMGSAENFWQIAQSKWTRMEPPEQEGWSKALGALAFGANPTIASDAETPTFEVVQFLLNTLNPSHSGYSHAVEARRDTCGSLVDLVALNRGNGCDGHLSALWTNKILSTLVQCTEDYSTERRGDVGSWVRKAAMTALGHLYSMVAQHGQDISEAGDVLLQRASEVEGALLKQMGEWNDRVRECGARSLGQVVKSLQLLSAVRNVPEAQTQVPLEMLVKEIEAARVETCESSWLFPRMVPLLGEADVALPLLHGLLATVGLAGDHHKNEAVRSIQYWVQPPEDHWEDGKHSTFRPQSNVEDTTARLRTALTLLGTIMKENFSKNKTVVPAMSLASTLLTTTTQPQERWNTLGDILEQVASVAFRALTKVRFVVRLEASRDFCLALLLRVPRAKPKLRQSLVKHMSWFLSHHDKGLRMSTSERLALSLDELLDVQLDQAMPADEDDPLDKREEARDACEECLLTTPWASLPEAQAAARHVQDDLQVMLLDAAASAI